MAVLPIGMSGEAGGYQIERSLRFNSADSTYMSRTPASAGNRKTWTWSGWVKRSALGVQQQLISAYNVASDYDFYLRFLSNDTLDIFDYNTTSGIFLWQLTTTQVFRDISSWYHIVISIDTTQATSSNRVKIYVNGVQVTTFGTATYPTQNFDTQYNYNGSTQIGRFRSGSSYFSGYLADIHSIDGSALTPSSFGETDSTTGVWKPKAYSGSYGTNGFYLKFADNSGTTSTTLGKDSSGNGNNWTPNNFSVTAGAGNDSLVDTPTPYGTDTGAGGEVRGNYCTLNPLNNKSTLSNGNLYSSIATADWFPTTSTFAVSSGKWYWEVTWGGINNSSYFGMTGIASVNFVAAQGTYPGYDISGFGYFSSGTKYNNGTPATYGASYTNDTIGVALDMDNGTIVFYKNGVSQGTAYTGLAPATFSPAIATYGTNATVNFGQRPFAYTAPSGFKALCTQNLPEPTVVQGDDYFNTVLYTGNGSTQSITGVGFQPDFSWFKTRNSATHHALVDAVRGVDKYIYSSLTSAEDTQTNALASFDADGFSFAGSFGNVNRASDTYVAWNWKANGSGVSNTAGTITSTVSANTTSGFSIVTYTGNGSANQTVGHGLGKSVDLLIIKSRTSNPSPSWIVWHRSVCSGNGKALVLEETNAIQGPFATPMWDSSNTTTQSSSTTFTIGANGTINTNTHNYVAYCFAPVAGFSAFGSYTGNGSTDGPFVYTGFRPAFVMTKRSDSTSEWTITDFRRPGYNLVNLSLYANKSNAELTYNVLDQVSNGFKLRDLDGIWNGSGGTYIYAAFAENPFKYSLAR